MNMQPLLLWSSHRWYQMFLVENDLRKDLIRLTLQMKRALLTRDALCFRMRSKEGCALPLGRDGGSKIFLVYWRGMERDECFLYWKLMKGVNDVLFLKKRWSEPDMTLGARGHDKIFWTTLGMHDLHEETKTYLNVLCIFGKAMNSFGWYEHCQMWCAPGKARFFWRWEHDWMYHASVRRRGPHFRGKDMTKCPVHS